MIVSDFVSITRPWKSGMYSKLSNNRKTPAKITKTGEVNHTVYIHLQYIIYKPLIKY